MGKFEHLRFRETKAWLLELEHAHQRKDRKSENRIRENLRRLGHRGGLRKPAHGEDFNQATFRVMQEIFKKGESEWAPTQIDSYLLRGMGDKTIQL